MLRYLIHYNNREVGQASLEKQGMFYRVFCRCSLPADRLFRIQMTTSEITSDLGICTPMEGGIGMTTRISVRELSAGDPEFVVVDETQEESNLFEISETSPFLLLESLETARFVRKDGKAFVKIPK